MSDTTTVDPAVDTTTVDPGTITIATDTPVNEAVPTTEVATPVDPATIIATTTAPPAVDPATVITTSQFAAPTTIASTFITSGISSTNPVTSNSTKASQTSSDFPFSGPPSWVTAGGRPPFATGDGPPFFNNDNDATGLDAGAKAGISVGIVATVFSVLAIALFLWRKKKREAQRDSWVSGPPEQLPSYTESNAARHPPPPGAIVEMKPKSAMKKVSALPMLSESSSSGSSTPTNYVQTTERRRSVAMEGTDQQLVLSIWEPANRSANSSAASSPVLGPVVPPKAHRKSNAGSYRPRRKSNLAPVSEEEMEAAGSRPPLPKKDSDSSESPPPTPRTPRTVAFHALTAGGTSSGQISPLNSNFSLDPMPPLPAKVSPVSLTFSDKDVDHVRDVSR